MPSSYPGRHMPLSILEPDIFGKGCVFVANWTTPVGLVILNKDILIAFSGFHLL
ncbi:hypothetical protein Hanom_Chr11g01026391 [Helianthus anomalus]